MAEQYADEPAYRDLDADESLTFAEWDARSNQVARFLIERGVEKGDRVAIFLPSDHCLQWITSYAAIHKAGAVMVPVNTRLSEPEVVAILRHAQPRAVVTCDALDATTRAVQRDVTSVTSVLDADGARDAMSGWNEALSFDASDVQVPLDDDDMADIMYTSGTTGLPKGVLVRHRNVAMMPNTVPHWSGRGWLHGAPLFTFAGMSFIYNPMKMGLYGLY